MGDSNSTADKVDANGFSFLLEEYKQVWSTSQKFTSISASGVVPLIVAAAGAIVVKAPDNPNVAFAMAAGIVFLLLWVGAGVYFNVEYTKRLAHLERELRGRSGLHGTPPAVNEASLLKNLRLEYSGLHCRDRGNVFCPLSDDRVEGGGRRSIPRFTTVGGVCAWASGVPGSWRDLDDTFPEESGGKSAGDIAEDRPGRPIAGAITHQ
jgi:hypothetical protein